MKEGNEEKIVEILEKLKSAQVVSIECNSAGSYWREECDQTFRALLTRDETILLAFWLLEQSGITTIDYKLKQQS